MRRALSFDAGGATLVGSLDEGMRDTALLIVTGGLQVRAGAHGGQARLAAAVAAAGHPVLRFDRRGIGDSSGADPGWRGQAADIAAATAAFRAAQPHVTRIVGYGLCDAAAALALHGAAAGIDALILANPWVVEAEAGLPPPAAIRQRYAARLVSRDAWMRVLRGRIDLAKAARGLRAALRPQGRLADDVARGLATARLPVTVLIARRDPTAHAFEQAAAQPGWSRLALDSHARDSASHGFAGAGDSAWLAERVIAALAR